MDILHYAEIALAAFIAGTIDTVVGFGGGLLLLPILVLMVGTLDAVLLTALIPLGWNIPRILLLRNWIDWNKTMWFTLGILPGALFGGQLLGHLDAATVRVGIGCVMVLFGGYYILRLYVDLPKERLPGLWPLPVVGLLTGAVSAWVGAGNGPLQTWALDASGLNAHQAAATNGALGGITAVARCIAYGIAGELHSGLIPTAVVRNGRRGCRRVAGGAVCPPHEGFNVGAGGGIGHCAGGDSDVLQLWRGGAPNARAAGTGGSRFPPASRFRRRRVGD
ncbi:MAG: Sulfite exporter TauE/SafE [Chlorobi bacterium OLB7]|nr:MAG: Sulfite exporter TauE/SafE [Chlorobi bacterium OLB7]